MLDEQQVVEIYMAKLALRAQCQDDASDANMAKGIKGQSVPFSVMYGVTSRTIRDIWNHLSWAYATRHLWDVGPQLSAENRIDKPTVEVVSHLDLIICFGRNIFVTLCRKIARQAFAVQGGPRDLEAQLLERQMPSMIY